MMPEKGQHIKCFMRNSAIVLEGIVEDWTSAQVILKSIEGESIIIIHRPSEDIMMTKIIFPPKLKENISASKIKQQIADQLHKVMEPQDKDLQDLNIQQLKELVEQQEKQIIAEKKIEHFGKPGNVKQAVEYSLPLNILKKNRK